MNAQDAFGTVAIFYAVANLASMGLELDLRETLRSLRSVRLLALTLGWSWIAGPALAVLLTKVLPMAEPYAIGLLIFSLAPTAPALPLFIRIARADMSLAAAIMPLSVVGTVVLMPLLAPILIPGLTVSSWAIGKPLLLTVLLPLVIGAAVKIYAVRAAEKIFPVAKKIAGISTLLLLVFTLVFHGRALLTALGSFAVAAQVLFTVGMVLAYFFGFGLNQAQRSSLALAVCSRNGGAMFVAITAFPVLDPRLLVMILMAVPVPVIVWFFLAKLLASRADRVTAEGAKRKHAPETARWDHSAACGAGGEKSPPASNPVNEENGAMRVYVGTYTGGSSRGIFLLELDRSSGRFVSGPVLAGETDSPSYLALHPNGRFLYAVNELGTFEGKPTGTVSAFSVDPATGRLAFLNRQASEGTDPCWVVVDAAGRNVLVANYTSGTVAVLPLSPDGRLQPASSVRHGSGSGPVRARQEGPHAHTVVLDAASRFAFWTDLGADRVRVDRFDAAAGTLEPNDPDGLALEPGSGPRHLAWHPSGRALYVLGELSAIVSTLGFDAGRGSLELAQSLSARADGASAENLAAAIDVSPDGRFLYTSNRGDDDLAVFAIDGDSLRLAPAGRVPSGGRGPRSFALDPSGRWLVTANQGSGSLVVFRRDLATGLPAAVGAPVAVPEPVCVLFAPEVPAGGRNQNSRPVAAAAHDRAPGTREAERGWRPR